MAARRFNVLQEEISYIPSRSAEVRKALKKLREIDALKEKTEYTLEELEKLAKETYWKNILDPPNTKAKEDEERKAKQYQRHMEKEAKKEAKRLAEEARMKKQQKREAEERAQKNKQRDDEYNRRKQEHEENRKAELERIERDNRFKQQYIDEFAKAVSMYKSPERAFRKLSLKYHPDKNPENIEESENIQKILGDIRSTYM